jgi:hypothetical protein
MSGSQGIPPEEVVAATQQNAFDKDLGNGRPSRTLPHLPLPQGIGGDIVLDERYSLDAQQFLGSLAEGAVALGIDFYSLHRMLLDGGRQ